MYFNLVHWYSDNLILAVKLLGVNSYFNNRLIWVRDCDFVMLSSVNRVMVASLEAYIC